MKTISARNIVAFCIAILGISLLHAADQSPKAEMNKDGSAWVQRCLADFQTIKVGMTRSQVESKFTQDGGVSTPGETCFTHPTCPYFKISVEFDFQRNPADQGRAIWGKDNKIIRVSKPYLENPYID
ncbi:MAG: hypothetical protein WCL04_01625 [Verrucomicrobiota bacterium]